MLMNFYISKVILFCIDNLIEVAGEGADYLVHLEVEEDGGGFGEGEGGGRGYFVECEVVARFQGVDNLLLVGG